MSKMMINVVFLPGTSIDDAIIEAKQKAKKWDVAYVCFKFNGKDFSIGRNVDICDCVEAYRAGSDFICDS